MTSNLNIIHLWNSHTRTGVIGKTCPVGIWRRNVKVEYFPADIERVQVGFWQPLKPGFFFYELPVQMHALFCEVLFYIAFLSSIVEHQPGNLMSTTSTLKTHRCALRRDFLLVSRGRTVTSRNNQSGLRGVQLLIRLGWPADGVLPMSGDSDVLQISLSPSTTKNATSLSCRVLSAASVRTWNMYWSTISPTNCCTLRTSLLIGAVGLNLWKKASLTCAFVVLLAYPRLINHCLATLSR